MPLIIPATNVVIAKVRMRVRLTAVVLTGAVRNVRAWIVPNSLGRILPETKLLLKVVKISYTETICLKSPPLLQRTSSFLQALDFELTERCNNNCLHCYLNIAQDNLKAQKRELATGEIGRILKEAKSLGCRDIRFTGGEPLLRKDFCELYTFAKSLGIRIFIFTNATLVTPQLAKLFRDYPPGEEIEVSLYGLKKGTYEAVSRIPGSYGQAKEGIRLLKKYRIPFILKSAAFSFNKDELSGFKKQALLYGAANRHQRLALFLNLHGRRDRVKNRLIRKLRLLPEEAVNLSLGNKEDYLKDQRNFFARFTTPFGDRLFSCASGLEKACVDAYGYLQPCMLLRHPATRYDLRKGSLRDAFQSFFPMLRKLRAKNPEYLKRCACCFLKGLCRQCPAQSWMEHGTLDRPVDYFCRIAHIEARILGLIKKDENGWELKDWKERARVFLGEKLYSRYQKNIYYRLGEIIKGGEYAG